MPKVLSTESISQYRQEGYFSPVQIMSADETAELRSQLEKFETNQGHPIEGFQRTKNHLLFKWIDELMRNPTLLDAVEDLIGENILCWNTVFWIKEANSPSYVGWHQDLQYWGLDNNELVSVWFALSPATIDSGCMNVIPGSHKQQLGHRETYHENNMLTRGQSIEDVDEAQAQNLEVDTGQAALFAFRIAHASHPNNSNAIRTPLTILKPP